MKDKNLSSLKQYLSSKGYKLTKQRQLIVDIFLKQKGHISAEELYDKIKIKDSSIGLATIYRTLKLLVSINVASERQFGDGSSRYEPSKSDSHHDHLICLNCNKIVEFENPVIEEMQQEVAKKNKFDISHHRLEIYGLCNACKNK